MLSATPHQTDTMAILSVLKHGAVSHATRRSSALVGNCGSSRTFRALDVQILSRASNAPDRTNADVGVAFAACNLEKADAKQSILANLRKDGARVT